MNSDQHSIHQYSVSDGEFPYLGSPSHNFKVPRWTHSVQKNDNLEITPTRGTMPEFSGFSQLNERCFAVGASSLSNSIGSGSPLSESGQWGSSSKGNLPPRHSISRRSFRSKPVYPLLFHNPLSGNEDSGLSMARGEHRSTPDYNKTSPTWPESDSSSELKFHQRFPDTSFRRQGFRWSNASSYDFGFEDGIRLSEGSSLENIRSLTNSDQKCVLCGRLLSHKSPWSSCRVIRNGDMPIAGVLPCSHVFHADCLEEITPKAQIHDPPCPVCSGTTTINESISHSEPLQMALRAAVHKKLERPSIYEDSPMGINLESYIDLKRNQSLSTPRRGSGLSIKNHLKKHFPFKGDLRKDHFAAKLWGRRGSASSSSMFRGNKK
ncbi:RING/U-box superfamily protein [Zostera marina]|uniref:RING/U-box superfamily protein n=1 Tax=Zostera marina TaxID=29655 RepID=A0A0K9PVF7_ZOSMR|nr:RING/U-box superfamily protein [Zostera marina]